MLERNSYYIIAHNADVVHIWLLIIKERNLLHNLKN